MASRKKSDGAARPGRDEGPETRANGDGAEHARSDAESEREAVGEAIARARAHARAAAGESLAAVHALLDAAALATSGAPADAHALLSPLATLLADLEAGLGEGTGRSGTRVLEAVADALDAEIARWEIRAREDPDARAVLRAFLGVRELLWEVGVRRRDEAGPRPGPARARGRKPGGGRVQRVPVEG